MKLAHKVSGEDDGYPDGITGIARTTSNEDPVLWSANVVGGTAFLFSRPEFEQAFDWLFVDEAGQVSLANLLAMGRAAHNIVLVGDPCQLPQVIQGCASSPRESLLPRMAARRSRHDTGRPGHLPAQLAPDASRSLPFHLQSGL